MITQKPLFYWIFHRHRLVQVCLLLVITAGLFFRVFPLEMQKRIVNIAIHLKKIDRLMLYCGLYLGAVFLAGILKYAANVLQKYLGQKILLEIRTELYAHILQLPLGFFRRYPCAMSGASALFPPTAANCSTWFRRSGSGTISSGGDSIR